MRGIVATALSVAIGLANASTLTPPVLPLIVRNPYLSTWLGNAREEPWSKWPMFYTGQSVRSDQVHSSHPNATHSQRTYMFRSASQSLQVFPRRPPHTLCWAELMMPLMAPPNTTTSPIPPTSALSTTLQRPIFRIPSLHRTRRMVALQS